MPSFSLILDMTMDKGTVSAVVLGAAFIMYFVYKKYSRAPLKFPPGAVAAGKVSKLLIYPAKSLVALPEVGRVRCVREGFITDDNDNIRDRSWMVINDHNVFVSQGAEPKLALLRPSIPYGGDLMHLEAPGLDTLKVCKSLSSRTANILDVSVWGQHVNAVDCGQEAADWFCKYLGRPGYRFVYLPPDMPGRKVIESKNPVDQKAFLEQDVITFSDVAPILLLSEKSVQDINGHVEDATISTRNFRPNIIISGIEAFEEDTWQDVYIGQVKLTNIRLCDRCSFTTVDPDKGVKHPSNEPIQSLRKFRPAAGNSPCLGIYMNVIQEGTMRVGDTIYVTKKMS